MATAPLLFPPGQRESGVMCTGCPVWNAAVFCKYDLLLLSPACLFGKETGCSRLAGKYNKGYPLTKGLVYEKGINLVRSESKNVPSY